MKKLYTITSTFLLLSAAVFVLNFARISARPQTPAPPPGGIQKIRHVIVIMQENRSFDHYFGTFPGADGIPMNQGEPSVCVPDPDGDACVKPYHDARDSNGGGPHSAVSATADIHGGKMDGFIAQAEHGRTDCANPNNPLCGSAANPRDVMGYHDDREIPNYWQYARNFVLQDRMFEPVASWSFPEHLFQVSEWTAVCTQHDDPSSCRNALQWPGLPPDAGRAWRRRFVPSGDPIYAWTDLTYLLHKSHITWGYYIADGTQPGCADDQDDDCDHRRQDAHTPGIWNPLPYFDTVKKDGELGNIQPLEKFMEQAKAGNLPAVIWIAPSSRVSEHPPARVSMGQAYVTGLINAVMSGPNWKDSAIFLAWDDWGGFYDHVPPPKVDQNGYGIRVPGLLISPYAKKGFIDHQTLSFDAYVKFIEDDFLGGQRLDPKKDGRPDPRPTVREDVAELGDLRKEFDFDQAPRAPMPLPLHPKNDFASPARRRPH